jgi:hypothetical protein
MQLFTTPGRTYATIATAKAKADAAAIRFGLARPRYIVAATDSGRFFPVFVVDGDDCQIGINLAHAGFCACN